MTLHMTEAEIVTSYREALYKAKQIGILADLNDCHKSMIRAILARHGLIPEAPKANRRGRKPSVPYDPAVVTAMIAQSRPTREIAAQYGVSPDTLRSYCRRRGIAITRPKEKKDKQGCNLTCPQSRRCRKHSYWINCTTPPAQTQGPAEEEA